MDRALVGALALACLLVLAGCANPLGPGDTPTPTPTTTPEPAPGDGTPTPGDETPTPDEVTATPAAEDLPPGISQDGIDNVTALLGVHTSALKQTGFVAVGNGSSVVRRSGVLIQVESSQRNRVAANGTVYETQRAVAAGPLRREVDTWSNGSSEFVRRWEDGQTNYSTRDPRSIGRLAGRVLLRPYLRGGDYEVRGVTNASGSRELVVLQTTGTGIANVTALEGAITDDAEEITGYNATVVVDSAGRVRSLEATVEYVISGQEATQEFDYALETVEGAEVKRPDWVDEVQGAGDESRRVDPNGTG